MELSSNIPLAKSGNPSSAFIGCNFTKQLFVFIIWKYELYYSNIYKKIELYYIK